MSPRVCLLVLSVLLCPRPSAAELGALDEVPAATLLLPYFEVDLANPGGRTTVFAVANTGEAPALAHISLWTHLGVPTLQVNAYLTGYDVMTVDLRALFTTGALPATAHDDDAVSPVGLASLTTNPDTGVGPGTTSCDGQLPLPALPAPFLAHLRQAHLGQPATLFGGLCAGVDFDDDVVRGYVTIDSVSACSLDPPSAAGYFAAGGLGVANNANVLVGDFALIDPSRQLAVGYALLHLEAASGDPLTQPGDYTFYARYSGGADHRESLPTTYWVRFAAHDSTGENASLIYWRDSKRTVVPFGCAQVLPSPFPLSTNQIGIFDAAENGDLPVVDQFSPGDFPFDGLLPFAFEAGRVAVGGPDLPAIPDEGWMFLNLNNFTAGSQVPHEPAMQGWIGVSFEAADGTYGYSHDAFALDNAGAFAELLLPVCDGDPDPVICPPLFADGFESGTTNAWSVVVP